MSIIYDGNFYKNSQRLTAIRPVMKLKNPSDVHTILLGTVENDFQLVVQKKATKLRVTFKTFRGKNQHLLG